MPPVLGYHRVVEDFATSAQTFIPSLLISTSMLESHIDWLGRRYDFVSVDEAGAQINGTSSRRRPCVALTFDDGYRDFYDLAFPLLRRKGVPAALYVVTDAVGTNKPQNHDLLYLLLSRRASSRALPRSIEGVLLPPIHSLKPFEATRVLLEALPEFVLEKLIALLASDDPSADVLLADSRSVSWEMLAEMQRAGITIGSHTCSHALLRNETEAVALREASSSRRELQNRLHQTIDSFAYPSGAYDEVAVRAVAAAGYKWAFTTCSHQNLSFPLLTIPRTLLWEKSCLSPSGEFSGNVLECLIEGAFDRISGCREAHQRTGRLHTAGAFEAAA